MIADDSSETLAAFQAKHPRPPTDSCIVPSDTGYATVADLSVPVHAIAYTVCSFPCGSASGPDGLTPQHLKDMIAAPAGEGGLFCCQPSLLLFILS